MPRRALLLLLLLALIGCAQAEQSPDVQTTSPEGGRAGEEPGDAATPDPAAVVLSREGLGVVRLGDDAETALARLRGVLGRPTTLTKWLPKEHSLWGRCPGEEVRGAKWGDLWVLFADSTELAGEPHVFGWILGQSGMNDRMPVRTAEGIGIGSTMADLRAAYGERVSFEPYEVGVRITIAPAEGEDAGGGILAGSAASDADTATLRALRAGLPCEA